MTTPEANKARRAEIDGELQRLDAERARLENEYAAMIAPYKGLNDVGELVAKIALRQLYEETRRDLVRAVVEREQRERYWDSVRDLMHAAGATGDAQHAAHQLVAERDAALAEVVALRDVLFDAAKEGRPEEEQEVRLRDDAAI